MSTGRSEFVRALKAGSRGRALWRELTGSHRSYRREPISWTIEERLDPQSVKGEPLNFLQVQSIDRESERFEDVSESVEVFVVTIVTIVTAAHDGLGIAGTDDRDAREIRQAARITRNCCARVCRGGSVVSVSESPLASTLSIDQSCRTCLCLELTESYNPTRSLGVKSAQCLLVLLTVPAFGERLILED